MSSSDNNFTAVARALADRAEDYVRHLFPSAKMLNGQMVVGSLLGEPGKSLKFTIRGRWAGRGKDHESGWEGDLLKATEDSKAMTNIQAADYARAWAGMPAFSSNGHHHVETEFDPLKLWHPRFKRCGDSAWRYPDATGKTIANVVRFTDPVEKDSVTGKPKKDYIPCRKIDGEPRWKGFTKEDELAPIYGLHLLARNPDATVLIVEGEKAADAAGKIFTDLVCVSWMGGTAGKRKVDWAPVLSRNVILWPDNDEAGLKAMRYIKTLIPTARMVDVSKLPPKWDLADPAPEGVSIEGMLDASAAVKPMPSPDQTPFTYLGYSDGAYHYLAESLGVIVRLKASEHTRLNLQQLAPPDFWECMAPGRDGTDYNVCAEFLIAQSHRVGIFDPGRIHGRGCTVEPGNQVVYHAGDRLFVNGIETPIHSHKSKFIYPRQRSITLDLSDPLSLEGGMEFNTLCSLLPWKDPQMAWMFAATMLICPICGALPWRPHSWLIGISGSGKSWTLENVIAPILGQTCLNVQSTSTAAGVKSSLGSDAFPVVWDEFEGGKGQRGEIRTQEALELGRTSSSDSAASIVKGTATGGNRSNRIRSMFFYSSIAMFAVDFADLNRINQFEFQADKDPVRFDQLVALMAKTVANPKWCDQFRARAVHFAADIRAACSVFTRAIAKFTGEARTGQQLGPVFAGSWFLSNDTQPTEAEAAFQIANWKTPLKREIEATDENQVLAILYQHNVRLPHGETHSIEDLLSRFFALDDVVPGTEAAKERSDVYETLMQHGIHPMQPKTKGGGRGYQCFHVDNSHVELRKIYRETAYSDRWKTHFLRIPGSFIADFHTASGSNRKAVLVRWNPEDRVISPEI